jgi:hypothetical protein
MLNPYGGSGSIVVVPVRPLVTSRRLGTVGARLHDTANGRRRTATRPRNGSVTSNKVAPIYTITLSEEEALARVKALASSDTAHLNLNVHNK